MEPTKVAFGRVIPNSKLRLLAHRLPYLAGLRWAKSSISFAAGTFSTSVTSQ